MILNISSHVWQSSNRTLAHFSFQQRPRLGGYDRPTIRTAVVIRPAWRRLPEALHGVTGSGAHLLCLRRSPNLVCLYPIRVGCELNRRHTIAVPLPSWRHEVVAAPCIRYRIPMATTLIPDPPGVQEIALRDALEERYLSYALSTIMHRALPDARDGLKPVHRRLMYAMRVLRLEPGAAFKKCARGVGDVIGKFHPHGDQSGYDALGRLAQDFGQRYPLIGGPGHRATFC